MANILSRFADIMASNINALLDKCEDPAKMIDQTLRNLRESLAEVKADTASVMADEKAAKRRLDECKEDIRRYETAARNALIEGQDEDAKKLIASKQRAEGNLESLQKTYDAAAANASKMRQMYDKLVNDIDDLESRRDNIKAKVNVAKAQERINKMADGARRSADSVSSFERFEAKADKMLDEAMAGAELNAGAEDSADNLAEKYAGKGSTSSVDAELEAMRAQIRQENSQN